MLDPLDEIYTEYRRCKCGGDCTMEVEVSPYPHAVFTCPECGEVVEVVEWEQVVDPRDL